MINTLREMHLHPYAKTTSTPNPSFTSLGIGLLQRKCACGQHTVAGGECEECRQKREGTMQRAAVSPAPANSVPPIVHDALSSSGKPLDAGTRAFMEPRFGHDFSQVRVHTDARAAESARAVNALAYTVGRDVVFGARQYEPGTSEGRRLMAHELTHVVQQEGGIFRSQKDTMNNAMSDPFEQQADRMAQTVTEVAPISPVQLPRLLGVATWLQRQPAPDTKSATPLPICEGKTLEDFKKEIEKTTEQAKKDPTINIPKLYLVLKRTRTCFPPPEFDEAQFLSLSLPTRVYSDEMQKAVRGSYKGVEQNDDRKMIWAESKKPFAGYLLSGLEHAPHFTTGERQRQLGYTLTPSHKKAAEFADERAKAHKSFSEADVLVFSGHQYAQYKLPGLWSSPVQGVLDLRNLPALPNVKLVISTSCATLCREAAAIWKSLFPNAVFLGARRSTPLEGDALAKEFVSKLPEDLLLGSEGGDISQAVSAWKSVTQKKYAGNANIQPGWLDISSGTVEFWDGKKWGTLAADSAENACKVKGDYSGDRPLPPPL